MGARMGLSGEAWQRGAGFLHFDRDHQDKVPWGDIQEVFYELKAPTDPNQAGMELVRCINRNLLATTTQTPEIQFLMGKVQTLQFDCYDGTQWRNTWDTSAGDTNLPVAVRVSDQLVSKQGEGSGQPAAPGDAGRPRLADAYQLTTRETQ